LARVFWQRKDEVHAERFVRGLSHATYLFAKIGRCVELSLQQSEAAGATHCRNQVGTG
jgi:hypothetical protein